MGLGSSEVLISDLVPGLEHPHNDYLRVWHDLGIVGVVLFCLAWIGRLAKHFPTMAKVGQKKTLLARSQMAAALAASTVVLTCISDNTLLYTFVQIPVFLLFAVADSDWERLGGNCEIKRFGNSTERAGRTTMTTTYLNLRKYLRSYPEWAFLRHE